MVDSANDGLEYQKTGGFYRLQRMVVCAVVVLLMSLAIGTTQASARDPRCDGDFWSIQKTDSQSRVIVDTGLTATISKQNDSTLAMTCFDQALKMTAKAGEIFSDSVTPPSVASLIGGGLGAGLGMMGGIGGFISSGVNAGSRGSTLIKDLSNTIGGTMQSLIGNFAGALSSIVSGLIGGSLGGMLAAFAGPIVGAIAGLFGAGGGLGSFSCDNMKNIWNDAVGQGLSASVIDMEEILIYAALGVMPEKGFSPQMLAKLNNWQNKEILMTAYHNNIVNLPVNGPLKFVKSIPALYVDSTLEEVIRSMDEIEEKPGLIPLPMTSAEYLDMSVRF